MIIVFLGPPGAGKGTQAAKFAQNNNLPHIATGDMLREAVKESSTLGLKAKSFMESGGLVPDTEIINMIKERISKADSLNGFVLDGFPRTIDQAKALDEMLSQVEGKQIDKIVNINVPDTVIIERLSGRRICKKCRVNYHIMYAPPKKKDLCDQCDEMIHLRTDDRPEVVKERLKVYQAQTTPLIDYYNTQAKLVNIRGESSMTHVSKEILEKLGG